MNSLTLSKPELRRIFRMRLGLTQHELSSKLGYSPSMVNSVETGRRNSSQYDEKLQKLYREEMKAKRSRALSNLQPQL